MKNKIKSKFTKDAIWLTLAQVFLALSAILINIIIGNKYGAANLGIFNQAVAIFLLISAIVSLGLNNTTIKKISQEPDNFFYNTKILNGNLFISLCVSTVVFLLGYFTIERVSFLFSGNEIAPALKILLICLPLYNLNKILMSFLVGLSSQKEFSFCRFLRWSTLILFIIIYSISNQSIFNIYYAFLFSEIILFIFLYINISNYLRLSISKKIIKENLKFGFKSYIAEIISFTKDRLDIIIVGYFISEIEMGVFTFSYSFASGILIVSSVLMQNISPIISELWYQEKYESLINKINSIKLKIVYLQSLFFVIILIGFNFVIPLITDLPINNYLLIFNILLIGFFIFSCSSWLGSFLIMTNNLNLNIIRISLILVFSISMLLFFSYKYGILGASIAICLSSVFSFFMINFFISMVIKRVYE